MADQGGAARTLLNGAYRVERVIGEGAFGRVYFAMDTRLSSPVAIKELRADRSTVPESVYLQYLERFQREARAARLSQHPNIVTVYALDVDSAHNYYLVMEYVDGTDLRDLLAQVGALPIERAVAIALEVAKALDAVHEQNIVHRDLKPANIMLTRRGVAKLADFGVAQVGHESMRTQIEASHPGTPMYMSPEQAGQSTYLDGRSDLFALGLILYEMLAGEAYVRRRLPLAEARPDTPPALVAIVEKMIAPDRDRRYQSAAAVVEDLQRLSTLPVSAPIAAAQPGAPAPTATVLASPPSGIFPPQGWSDAPTPTLISPNQIRSSGKRGRLVIIIGVIVVAALVASIIVEYPLSRRPSNTMGASPSLTAPAQLIAAATARPGDPDSVRNLADYYDQTGQYQNELVLYQQYLKLRPDDADGHVSLGDLLANTGDLQGAQSQYMQAIALKPTNASAASAHLGLGRAYTKAVPPRNNDALNEFQQASALDPTGEAGNEARTLLAALQQQLNVSAGVPAVPSGTVVVTAAASRSSGSSPVGTPTRTPASTSQTTTWTDPSSRLSLQYPVGWNPGRTTSPNQLATFEGPNGVRFTVIVYATGTMTADQAVQNLLSAQQGPAYQSLTFSHDPVMDGTIAGEPAKVLNQSFVSKNNTAATPTTETLTFVKHATTVWEFIATNPGVHKPEIEAILASVMFLQ